MTLTPDMRNGAPPQSPAASTATASKQHDRGQGLIDPEWRAIPARMGDLFDGVDPIAFGIALSRLHEDDPYAVAARLAISIADGRRGEHRALREVAYAIHGGRRRFWSRQAQEPSHEELQRRREVERGPDGAWRSTRRGVA